MKKPIIQKTRISSDRKQIILDVNAGFRITLFDNQGSDKEGRYDEVEVGIQIPSIGSTKRLDPEIIKALEKLRGEKTVKNIKIIIDTVKKV